MSPTFRATIRRDGLVRLVDWHAGLVTWGPLSNLLESRSRAGVTIADLTVEQEFDEDGEPLNPNAELTVTFLTRPTGKATRALTDWAALVGYSRIWLPDGIHDLEPTAGGRVSTHCSACRHRLTEAHADFWAFVRNIGHFPMACPLCGADLPQWTAAPPATTTDPRSEGAHHAHHRPVLR